MGIFMEGKYYKTICNNHNEIIHLLKQMKHTKDIRPLINEALDFVRYAKKQGQRMENRLTLYKETIEKLGFKRDYRTK